MIRLISGAWLFAAFCSAQSPSPSELDRERISLDKQRLKLDEERMRLENSHNIWMAVASTVPIVVALGTLFYGVWSVKRTVQGQTMLKLTELMLEGHVPDAVAARARLLTRMLKDSLPRNFHVAVEELEPATLKTNTAPPEFIQIRIALVRLFAEFPNQREQILHDIGVYFPGDAKLLAELASNARSEKVPSRGASAS